MGEAKRRGTREQRIAEAEAKRLESQRAEVEVYRVRRELEMRKGKSRLPAVLAMAAALSSIGLTVKDTP